MTYTEVLELIRAGYTKSEIDQMIKDEAKTIPQDQKPAAPQDQKQEAPAGDPQKDAPAAPQDPQPAAPSESEKLMTALGVKLDNLTSAIQSHNVKSVEGTNNTISSDDIIAKIINPHYGEVE